MEEKELDPRALAVLLVPVSLLAGVCLLLVFGDRSATVELAPAATVVSDTSGQPCVMLCDRPESWSMAMPSPSTSSEMCPPFCEFERW